MCDFAQKVTDQIGRRCRKSPVSPLSLSGSFRFLLGAAHSTSESRRNPLVDLGLEDLVRSFFPARRNFTELDPNRLIHERQDPMDSLFAESTILPESHDY